MVSDIVLYSRERTGNDLICTRKHAADTFINSANRCGTSVIAHLKRIDRAGIIASNGKRNGTGTGSSRYKRSAGNLVHVQGRKRLTRSVWIGRGHDTLVRTILHDIT